MRAHRTAPSPSAQRTSRDGFTLIELLMVILIIAALMALILPALNSTRTTARNAQVKAEITRLDTAIAAFKARYNVDPPSALIIPARAPSGNADWSGAAATSKRAIRQIWPQFNFAANGGLNSHTDVTDVDTDGDTTEVLDRGNPELVLSGAECILFFLGGPANLRMGSSFDADEGDFPWAPLGFSKNPATPWSRAGTNRVTSFYEFDINRVSDVDGDFVAEYIDTLPDQAKPFLYVATRRGNYPATGAVDYAVSSVAAENITAVYSNASGQPYKKDSYQIISPGIDGVYGTGGNYSGSVSPDFDADNITNFNSGATLGE